MSSTGRCWHSRSCGRSQMPFVTCTLDSVFCIGVPVFSDLESFSGFIVDEFHHHPPTFVMRIFKQMAKLKEFYLEYLFALHLDFTNDILLCFLHYTSPHPSIHLSIFIFLMHLKVTCRLWWWWLFLSRSVVSSSL